MSAAAEFPNFRPLRAFLALGLHSSGRDGDALQELLETIAEEGEYERHCAATRPSSDPAPRLWKQLVDGVTHERGDALDRLFAERHIGAHQPDEHRADRTGHAHTVGERDRRVREHSPETL